MERIDRSNDKINQDIDNAGKTFIGLYMEHILIQINDGFTKNDIVDRLYKNQVGFYDKGNDGTNTRVLAIYRIIKADKVIYALRQIVNSNYTISKQVKVRAEETIHKIEKGSLRLPNLD